MLAIELPAYHESIRKRQKHNPKHYLFDCGIKMSLERVAAESKLLESSTFGKMFEHFLVLEIYRLCRYMREDYELFYLRTKDNADIDLIIDRPGLPTALIEIKSTTAVKESDARTLNAFLKARKKSVGYILSRDPTPKKFGAVEALPWQAGIKELI